MSDQRTFYLSLFKSMAKHISDSEDFLFWAMTQDGSVWEEDTTANGEVVRREDWQVVAEYLKYTGDMTYSGTPYRKKQSQ